MLSAVPVGPEFLVNTQTALNQVSPSVAMDWEGNFVVVWLENGSGSGETNIYLQWFDAGGQAQGAEFRVHSDTPAPRGQPAVAMDGDGDFVVAWMAAGPTDYDHDVYARRFNAAGVPQGDEFRVNATLAGNQWFPAVAMDADGNFVVAWSGGPPDVPDQEIFAQRYNAAGVMLGGEFRVNSNTIDVQWLPAVAMDADGDFVVTWTSRGEGYSGYDVFAQRYNAAGVPQGVEFRVNTHTFSEQFFSTVAVDREGNFVIAWTSLDQVGLGWDVFAQRYDATGSPRGGEFRVNTHTTLNQGLPKAAMDAVGNFVVTWSSELQDGSMSGVFAQLVDSKGNSHGGELQVNTYTTHDQTEPSVAMTPNGNFVVSWTSYGQDGSGPGVYAQRFTMNRQPEVTDSAFHFVHMPHRLSFKFSTDVSASLGVDDLLVRNVTTSQTIPADQFILSYDTSTNTATFAYIGGGGTVPGVLPDGRYRATLLSAGITDPTGTVMTADHVFDFFFLNGDATRDEVVNLADFNILAARFGNSLAGPTATAGPDASDQTGRTTRVADDVLT